MGMQLAINRTENDIINAYWDDLRTLSIKAKLQLASLLTTAALEEETRKSDSIVSSKSRVVKRRAANVPTDEQLEQRFAGAKTPEIPEDLSWSVVINANTGKTIKPIEKWL